MGLVISGFLRGRGEGGIQIKIPNPTLISLEQKLSTELPTYGDGLSMLRTADSDGPQQHRGRGKGDGLSMLWTADSDCASCFGCYVGSGLGIAVRRVNNIQCYMTELKIFRGEHPKNDTQSHLLGT